MEKKNVIKSRKDKIISYLTIMKLRIYIMFSNLLRFFKSNLNAFFSWLVLLVIFLVFKNKITTFFAENSILKHDDVKTKYFNSVFILIIIIVLIRFSWYILKNFRLSVHYNFIVFSIALIYLLLRSDNNDSLFFTCINEKCSFFYSDIILIIAICTIILFIRNKFLQNWKLYDKLIISFEKLIEEKEENSLSFLIEDTPQNKNRTNDNERVINEVVEAVLNLKPSNSFIIGINSIWGVGKTSFLKRLEHKLQFAEKEDGYRPITFWFNAWQHQDEKSIINNFFNQLKKELSVFSGNSKSTIDSYLKEMFALVDSKYFNFFKSIIESFFSTGDTIKDSYNEINDIIDQIDRKIIVFVDDIDRLNKTEILETLRILRNIADFKNMIFVCGFDREYVVKQSQIDNHYLDKIFNLEVNLPTQNQKSFVVYLNELISNSSAYDEKTTCTLIESINKIFYSEEEIGLTEMADFLGTAKKDILLNELKQIELIPSFFFESRRDVKKFFNEFYINIKVLKNISDIELEEYIQLKLLLFKYKWMYKNFASKRIGSWLGDKDRFIFSKTNLNDLYIHPDVENQDKIIIYSVLKNLFPERNLPSRKSINVKRYFPIYFSNNIFNESFSFTQLYSSIENLKVEELILENIIGSENEDSVKSDIKSIISKDENINNENEYVQVIQLIKKGLLGHLDEREILDIVYIGETKFKAKFKELLNVIFTNFSDDFGFFLNQLSFYHSKKPKDIDYNNDLGNTSLKKIEELKILNKIGISEVLFKVLKLEIDNYKDNPTVVLSFSNSFYDKYFSFFNFGVLSEEFKIEIKEFIKNNFETIFLSNDSINIFQRIDIDLISKIFEDVTEREKIIKQAEYLLQTRNSWKDSDLITRTYIIRGLDSFISFVEAVKALISENLLEEYYNLLNFLHAYQANGYSNYPSDLDIVKIKSKKLK